MFNWTGTSESSPSVGSTGESFVTTTGKPGGGGALRSGPLYGILRMDESEFGDVCRGMIGSGQRVCLRTECNILLHSTKKMSWVSLVGDNSSCIFIRGGSGSEGEAAVTIFGSPILPGACVRDSEWSELETSPRSLESWQATFTALKQAASASGVEGIDEKTVADVLESTKQDVKFVFTPARKKQRFKDGDHKDDVKPSVARPPIKPVPFLGCQWTLALNPRRRTGSYLKEHGAILLPMLLQSRLQSTSSARDPHRWTRIFRTISRKLI